jgi:hypothetical protein
MNICFVLMHLMGLQPYSHVLGPIICYQAERRAREKAKEAELKVVAEEERKREKERRSLEESIQS